MPTYDDYQAILKDAIPVIDVRAPAEFAQGAIPSAVNLPILTDDEREQVGKCYASRGQEAAIELGHTLVNGAVKAARVDAWRAFVNEHPNALICCWRGGLRSQLAQSWLEEAGMDRPRIAGGSKALRQYVSSVIDQMRAGRWIVLAGRTGSGKTLLLRGLDNAIDLEAHANHRGSAFGGFATPQPPPVSFENAITADYLRCDRARPIVVEDESRTIGRLALPTPIYEAMQEAPVVALETPIEDRIANIYDEYVRDDPHGEQLMAALSRIRKRLGGLRFEEINALMAGAFASGSREEHDAWICRLLADYYDPMYDHQLAKKIERTVFKGSAAEVTEYMARRAAA